MVSPALYSGVAADMVSCGVVECDEKRMERSNERLCKDSMNNEHWTRESWRLFVRFDCFHKPTSHFDAIVHYKSSLVHG